MSAARSERIADLERAVHDLQQRFARLGRNASAATPRTAERVSDAVAAALSEVAARFGGRADSLAKDATRLSDEALEFGNDALRKLTREVEQRPLVVLAVAVGVGMLAAGLLARRASN